jgi:septal ring factor EnvC (AmiA/AmiB activator)
MPRTVESYVERVTIVKNEDGTIKEIMAQEIDKIVDDGVVIRQSYGDLKAITTGQLRADEVVVGLNDDAIKTIDAERKLRQAKEAELAEKLQELETERNARTEKEAELAEKTQELENEKQARQQLAAELQAERAKARPEPEPD